MGSSSATGSGSGSSSGLLMAVSSHPPPPPPVTLPSELSLARAHPPASSSPRDAMVAYRQFRDAVRAPIGVLKTYSILGFLSSGTYGRVYKARLRPDAPAATRERRAAGETWQSGGAAVGGSGAASGHYAPMEGDERDGDTPEEEGDVYAIKKFKPDKEESNRYTGISQSAMREIAVSEELGAGRWVLGEGRKQCSRQVNHPQLNRELSHVNMTTLREVILEDKAICEYAYAVFEM